MASALYIYIYTHTERILLYMKIITIHIKLKRIYSLIRIIAKEKNVCNKRNAKGNKFKTFTASKSFRRRCIGRMLLETDSI